MSVVKKRRKGIRFYDLTVWEALISLRIDIIKLMVENKFDFNFIDKTRDLAPVHMAVALNNRVALDLMCSGGADILIQNSNGENIVDIAERHQVSDEMFDYAVSLWIAAHEAAVGGNDNDVGRKSDIVSLARKRRERKPGGPS
jgi:hypothetical protein